MRLAVGVACRDHPVAPFATALVPRGRVLGLQPARARPFGLIPRLGPHGLGNLRTAERAVLMAPGDQHAALAAPDPASAAAAVAVGVPLVDLSAAVTPAGMETLLAELVREADPVLTLPTSIPVHAVAALVPAWLAVLVPARDLPAAVAGTRVHALFAQAGHVVQPHAVGALPPGLRMPVVPALRGRPLANSDRFDRGRGQLDRVGWRALAVLDGRVGGENRNLDGLRLPTLRHDRGSDGLRLGSVSRGIGDRRDRVGLLRLVAEQAVDEVRGAGGEVANERREVEHGVLLEGWYGLSRTSFWESPGCRGAVEQHANQYRVVRRMASSLVSTMNAEMAVRRTVIPTERQMLNPAFLRNNLVICVK